MSHQGTQHGAVGVLHAVQPPAGALVIGPSLGDGVSLQGKELHHRCELRAAPT